MEAVTEAPHVYRAISAITAIMAQEGIAKSRRNDQQGYQFRGIDEVYAALSAHLADQKLCVLPRVMDRTFFERATKSGGVSTYTILVVEFDLISAIDGSKHTICTIGEAMDSADKSSNKAMSAAMKYACLMAFQIPTAGDNDADRHHPQKAAPRNAGPGRSPSARGASPPAPRAEAANGSQDDWLEWALRHTVSMKQAESAGALKSAYSTAWREAEHRGAPPHIFESLTKCKNDLKSQFSEAS